MTEPLSQQERDRFATYLEKEAETNLALSDQLKKLPFPLVEMAKKLEVEAVAQNIVANVLRAVTTETI